MNQETKGETGIQDYLGIREFALITCVSEKPVNSKLNTYLNSKEAIDVRIAVIAPPNEIDYVLHTRDRENAYIKIDSRVIFPGLAESFSQANLFVPDTLISCASSLLVGQVFSDLTYPRDYCLWDTKLFV